MDKILFIVTAATSMSGEPTGFWYEELGTPYYAFQDAGYEVVLASIPGGELPVDKRSLEDETAKSVERFQHDQAALAKLSHSVPIETVEFEEFAGIFFPGGHGAVVDLPESELLAEKLGKAYDVGVVIGAVCHGPGGLVGAVRADGKPLVAGKRVNSFTNAEEEEAGQTETVPFLLETRLRELGGLFEGGPNWQEYAVRDGHLVTGQNPASSEKVAELMIEAIKEK